ncbi:putative membrane-anchored protein [Aneurinibacillus soli]|uniref:Thiamin pyrophosphokinase, catalytic domain n=2 Tax=Aneurinibacillus soli TaxID=1500254 RepID=A0A0U4WL42_9BACL|nr:putative membrane-anchored protein [Aneurinibacillus soli]BAU29145.1 Thiamin pyrophosphokinase, catalytic domain [Aneurinibacillus soli]
MLSRLMRHKYTAHGPVRCGSVTKRMVPHIQPGDIAVIAHAGIDELAARSLIERKVRAVVNCEPSLGTVHAGDGARLLIEQGIPLYDCLEQPDLYRSLVSGEHVVIEDCRLFRHRERTLLARLLPVTREQWHAVQYDAVRQVHERMTRFVDNTLWYAAREKQELLHPLPTLPLRTPLAGRHAVIVVRGRTYREDLRALVPYIRTCRPALIGVDGGADALLAEGFRPDIVFGDMDSVSDKALRAATDRIVHAYVDGRAPGTARIHELGLTAHVLPSFGTSEDAALLYAYEQQASLLVAVGTHASMADCLAKGREGMGSTWLVRMKIGDRLLDAKGISRIYPAQACSLTLPSWLVNWRRL